MRTRSLMCLSAAALVAAVFCGCSNNKTAKVEAPAGAMTMANTKCPYSGEAVNSKVTSDYHGKQVGFCCAGCKARWDKATDAQRDAMLTKAK